MANSKSFPKSKKFYISRSAIHGYGIFARRLIKKGEVIFIIKGQLISWRISNEREALTGPDWIGVGKNQWIDPAGRTGQYINHSSEPTCGIKGRVSVCALQDIKKNEEVTIDYAITEEAPLWHMEDAKGTKETRIVRAIQFMPEKKFKKYLPYIPDYFQTIYRSHHRVK